MRDTKCGFDSAPGGPTGGQFLVAIGPTLFVQIGFDPHFNPKISPRANIGGINYEALVDTGATECCIDGGLAMQLGLPLTDRRRVAGAHGAAEVNVHIAQIYIPSLDFTMHGLFSAVDLIGGGQRHHALIGRTFLQRFRMTYEGDTGTAEAWCVALNGFRAIPGQIASLARSWAKTA